MTLGLDGCARSMMVLLVLGACSGGDAERAAQGARLAALEEHVRKLEAQVSAQKALPPAANPDEVAAKMFKVSCLPPWQPHAALGATLWACRSPVPAPEGVYAQCSVVTE